MSFFVLSKFIRTTYISILINNVFVISHQLWLTISISLPTRKHTVDLTWRITITIRKRDFVFIFKLFGRTVFFFSFSFFFFPPTAVYIYYLGVPKKQGKQWKNRAQRTHETYLHTYYNHNMVRGATESNANYYTGRLSNNTIGNNYNNNNNNRTRPRHRAMFFYFFFFTP